MLKFLIFLAAASIPLLLHRNAAERVKRIDSLRDRMGDKQRNPGANLRYWKAKKTVAILWTVIAVAIELLAFHFVNEVGGAIITAIFADGLGYILSQAFFQTLWNELEDKAFRIQSAPGYVGVIDSMVILKENQRFRKNIEPPPGDGSFGTAQKVDGALTDMVDLKGTFEARGGR